MASESAIENALRYLSYDVNPATHKQAESLQAAAATGDAAAKVELASCMNGRLEFGTYVGCRT
jgi:hypothetical protein